VSRRTVGRGSWSYACRKIATVASRKAITEELCGHRFSASSISAINKRLDASLAEFARRRLEEPYPYLILDAPSSR
jgi:transposase-like protein